MDGFQSRNQPIDSADEANIGGLTRNRIARLNVDGSVDTTFDPNANSSVYSLAVQADEKVLVGGPFSSMGGLPRNWIARLNADGSVDPTFNPNANNSVLSLAVQADGKVLVGGWFHSMGGQTRNHIARLNANGSVDPTFNPNASSTVYSLAVQADGKVLLGGTFTSVGGQTRNCLAGLEATEPATQSLGWDGSTITWLRGGTSPEVWRTTFEYSTNGADWIALGAGERITGLPVGQTGGWQLTGVFVPSNSILRARGFVTGGQYNGSSWFVDSTLAIPQTHPRILVNDLGFGFCSNQFGFNFVGSPGSVMAVEGSTNLVNWLDLMTLTNANGTNFFTDPATNLSRRFYRARQTP